MGRKKKSRTEKDGGDECLRQDCPVDCDIGRTGLDIYKYIIVVTSV